MTRKTLYLLPQAILNAAERFPEHEAVRFGSQGLTYAELVARSTSLARTLIDQGVVRGERVGIYLHKSLESAIALYAIMLAGAAYVPLDPFAPVARLSYVVRNCGIRCLVTNEAQREALQRMLEMATPLECLIGLASPIAGAVRSVSWEEVFQAPDQSLPQVGTIEQDLAYILYTSGSTGDPKGIMHTHRSALSFAEWGAATYGLHHGDRLSNHAPLHFDLSTFDFFAGALVGATTSIISEALTKFPANVARLMERERLSIWYSVPFALIQLLQHGSLESRDLSALRWLLFAGEPFPTKHLRPLMERLPHVRFSNLFGPTETNVCTFYHVPPLPADSDEPIPIGEPCANVDALIVDGDDDPVPAGEPGELLIRSPLVTRGYWARPDLTQRAFFTQPAFEHYEDYYYRTGDLVQLQPDGNLKYLGRKDRQIKTRGYRVELDEVEVALLSWPLVEEAAAYAVPDGQGSNLIEASVTARADEVLDIGELVDHVAAQLPDYAVPHRITLMEIFPRTSTGKINRRALRQAASGGGDQ